MRHKATSHKRRPKSAAGRVGAVASAMSLIWLAISIFEIVQDQIVLLPPPPPTPDQVIADTPKASAVWAKVYADLSAQVLQPPPLELGEVWATRTFRICRFVNARDTAVDDVERFYTVDHTPVVRDKNLYRYIRIWTSCLNDHWIELHGGTEKTGFCASKHGRESVLGRQRCADWKE